MSNIKIKCGPFKGNELKGIGIDEREEVDEDKLYNQYSDRDYDDYRTCNEKCQFYKECLKEVHSLPSKNKFVQVKANIKEIERGKCSVNGKGEIVIWKLIEK